MHDRALSSIASLEADQIILRQAFTSTDSTRSNMARKPSTPARTKPSSISDAVAAPDKSTLQVWTVLTQLSTDDLKRWVLDTILPDLWLFLEWRQVMSEKNKLNQSPSLRAVIETIKDSTMEASQFSDALAKSAAVSSRMLWAHTVLLDHRYSSKNDNLASSFDTRDRQLDYSFELVKFFGKNMGERRYFKRQARHKAQGVRKKKSEGKVQNLCEL